MEGYRAQERTLIEKISKLKQPFGHGTTSDHLDDILSQGLGARVPDNAYAGTRSAFDLQKPDGLLGSYLFARFNAEDLRIKNDNDLIERYSALNSKYRPDRLRASFRAYAEKRKPKGFPVVLIYDGAEEVKFERINPDAESELTFSESIGAEKLRMILVPDIKIEVLKSRLKHSSIEADVLPVEILEL